MRALMWARAQPCARTPVMQDLIKILHSHHNWLCFKAVLLITNQLKIKFVNFNMEQIKRFYCDYLKV